MRKIPYARHLAFALAAFAAETLQRKTSIGELRVNPLLLSLEIKDFALSALVKLELDVTATK